MITPLELRPNSKANQVKVLRMPSGVSRTVTYRLTDDDGQIWPLDASKAIIMTSKETLTSAARFQITGTISNQTTNAGEVVFDLAEADTSTPGIFLGEVSYGEPDAGDPTKFLLSATWPMYLAFEPSLLQDLSNNGPLMISEVRLMLDDLDVQDGISLLDDVEFSDVQIIAAIRRCVSQWNETPPFLGEYTPANFPYRYYLLIGVAGELLVMRANSYRRNRLQYSAGGVSVDDQNKGPEYEQVGQAKRMEYRQWLDAEKYRLNMSRGWGTRL